MTDEQVQQEQAEATEQVEASEPEFDLEALVAERDRYLDQLQRVTADFDNFRKRAARD